MSFLTKEEERIIGALIEKKYTTPEYYPLTLNALKNACNQKSNRNPVYDFTEDEVENSLLRLHEKKMVFKVSGAEHRVTKYNENFTSFFNLTQPEIAVMCVLMLRGPQTLGEIRGRTVRLHKFENLSEVEETIHKLMSEQTEPAFIQKLPRTTGRDPRYACILTGEVDLSEPQKEEEPDKVELIENEIENLKSELEKLKSEFEKFKKQFE